ncbi:S8 family peptidase [Brevundimonas sp.]|uniref:S8 family peptidase n=1 Tax=Brevundimonas sp. TaxID=1871086 RepID=UPI002D714EDB|nr:S8 family peptidase [Brevundimonas sp.]HYC99080.1 S8 family peptidase [Brevundimonas sp.]
MGRPGEVIDAEKFNKSGLTLLSVEPSSSRPDDAPSLVFFAPRDGLAKLKTKVEKFRDEDTRTGRPKNADLAQSIARLERATLRALWRGSRAKFPETAAAVDWEVWVANDGVEAFVVSAGAAGVHVAADRLDFPEQTVLRVTASRATLAPLVASSPHVRALAKPATTSDFFDSLPVPEQADWADELLERAQFDDDAAQPYVTLLDTGISLGHPLLAPVLSGTDRHAADPAWDLGDLNGHGTGMAGIATFGDLSIALHSVGPISVKHRLESAKVIPDAGVNHHHLLGAITRRGVNAVEAANQRHRVFTLASSTADDHPHDGAPTSWSTELDQLCSGRSGDRKAGRLFVIAAGNVKSDQHVTANYHAVCDGEAEELESPAQAWNPITVGASTDKSILGPDMAGAPLAPAGELSPFSKTASWNSTWPLKPDIVLEGGNLVLDNLPPALSCADLSLLTTHNQPAERLFTTFEATSAACALAARMAATVWSDYPDRWPETIRALLVASARWTNPMLSHLPAEPAKGDFELLFKRYGYGVPDLQRALKSSRSAITLIAEDRITPYAHSETRGAPAVHNEIKLHQLPWPMEELRRLGNHPVTLRIALSTFVEPNPAEAARGRKLQYASHGLRFKLNRANEGPQDFSVRINAAAQVDDGQTPLAGGGDDDGWRFGSRRRDVGSLHIDELTCPASDLARRSIVAVHPVAGWWKSKLRQDDALPRARYSLIIEIDAGDAEVDLHAEVSATIAAQIDAAVII